MSIRAFIKSTCQRAGKAGHQLLLEPTDYGHRFQWSHLPGLDCRCTAHTTAVALYCACEIYHEINFNFTT